MSSLETYKVKNPREAVTTKGAAVRSADGARNLMRWQADLWPDVDSAVQWANEEPLCKAGEIVFSTRDDGMVWTYTLITVPEQ
jgi:hypothetical protein